MGARPDIYKHYDSFLRTQDDILQEQADGSVALYIIYQQDKLVGRVNLRDIRANNASLGDRIRQSAVGKGVAIFAVKKL